MADPKLIPEDEAARIAAVRRLLLCGFEDRVRIDEPGG
jgi:hypothetical protein